MSKFEELKYPVNKYGFYQFPKGDIRRWFVLVAAIHKLPQPTIGNLSLYTGWNRGSVVRDIPRIEEQLGIKILKKGLVYSVTHWGNHIVKKTILENYVPRGL